MANKTTNTTKHTPGPWVYNDTWGLIYGADGVEVCALHSGIKANAHLITAAPEMLEALTLCQRWFTHQGKTGGDLPIFRAIVDAAIAKAEGGK